jgi:hypothetical protein
MNFSTIYKILDITIPAVILGYIVYASLGGVWFHWLTIIILWINIVSGILIAMAMYAVINNKNEIKDVNKVIAQIVQATNNYYWFPQICDIAIMCFLAILGNYTTLFGMAIKIACIKYSKTNIRKVDYE